MREQDIRTGALITEEGIKKLRDSTVAVFGIGGVGSYALEALVRSGIGRIYIYDNDTVSLSNINRQLVAAHSTVGMLKTFVAAAHCRDIDPETKIIEMPVFVTPETEIPFENFDFIIDAVDNVTAKLFLIENSVRRNIPIISVMGTGNKLDPTKLQISDIFSTRECRLARVMRTELKKRGIKKLDVVWSTEPTIKPADTAEKRTTGRPTPASMTFVPATAGLIAASYAVKKLLS